MFPPLAPLPTRTGTRFRVVSARPPSVVIHGADGETRTLAARRRGEFWEVFADGVGAGATYNWTVGDERLLDPCCLAVRGDQSVVVAPPPPMDWQRPRTPLRDSVIYELHVRGFTKTLSIEGAGTYRGLVERIPYLSDLGVTAVELLPVHAFPTVEQGIPNFWGYSPMAWFAPHPGYAEADPIAEFTAMVQAFHAAGIQVLIDVVFNHTAEQGADGPTLHFRALDPDRFYRDGDMTGCGNTINASDPVVRDMILDCLRWWHHGLGVDGFRFDLASVLRDMAEDIERDAALADAVLIAEAWDAAATYDVSTWPGGDRWAVWNDRFRDDTRHAWRGHADAAEVVATRLSGSSDLFSTGPERSVNFVTCHDGPTLADLKSDRHALMATLLLAQGVPMILAGDEAGRTQGGNENAYDQDNETSWVDWTRAATDAAFTEFVRELIRFRKATPALRRRAFLEDGEVRWFSADGGPVDWDAGAFGYELPGELVVFVNLTDTPAAYAPPPGWKVVVATGTPGILAACPPSHPS